MRVAAILAGQIEAQVIAVPVADAEAEERHGSKFLVETIGNDIGRLS